MRSSSALRQQLTRSRGSLTPSQGIRSVGRCQAELFRNGISVPNPMGSEEPKCRGCCSCCCLCPTTFLNLPIIYTLGPTGLLASESVKLCDQNNFHDFATRPRIKCKIRLSNSDGICNCRQWHHKIVFMPFSTAV